MSAEMRYRLLAIEARTERSELALAIADAASKLGITSEGVALTGPHLLMLLGDMVKVPESLFQQLGICRKQRECREARIAELERVMRDIRGANAAYALVKIDAALAQSAPAADEQGVKS